VLGGGALFVLLLLERVGGGEGGSVYDSTFRYMNDLTVNDYKEAIFST